ncbi:hypothetical protein, partial [Spirosoma endophyticum]|uniref:hypothetical protein n=1 Tax=Spirosoma endophyticum TaxID=662367 RepID=UPI001C43033C
MGTLDYLLTAPAARPVFLLKFNSTFWHFVVTRHVCAKLKKGPSRLIRLPKLTICYENAAPLL